MNLVPLAGTALSYLCLLTAGKKKDRPFLLLMFLSCHPAGKTLPSQNKFSKTLFSVALIKGLCFSSSHCLREMEMQGSAGLVLTEQLQIYCSVEEWIWREEQIVAVAWLDVPVSGGRGWCHCRNRAVNTHREIWMIWAKTAQILQQIWDLWFSKQTSVNLWEGTEHTNSKSPLEPPRKM